jgi:hypothetical protein
MRSHLNSPLAARREELKVAPQPSVGVPLLTSWTALVGLTAALSIHVAYLGIHPPASRLRVLELERNVDDAIDQCTDVYNYSCGHYGLHEPLDPWSSTRTIVSRAVKKLPLYKACEALDAAFWQPLEYAWTDYDGMDPYASGYACDLECKVELLTQGWVVNNVTARVTAVNGTYVHAAWTDSEGDNRTDCLWPHAVVLSGAVCDALDDELWLDSPPDLPADCEALLNEHAKTALTAAFALDPETLASLDAMADGLLKSATQLVVKPAVRFGGGDGLTADTTDFAGSRNVDLWSARRLAEAALLGDAVNPARWTTAATTVNAFFDAEMEAVYVPAGIIRSPFFDADWARDIQYGGLGFVLGHEIGHAIDHAVNDTSLLHEIGHKLAVRTHLPYEQVAVTEHEDIADAYGIELVETENKITKHLALQLAQMWCMLPGGFSDDPHAPANWRVNATLGGSEGWRKLACGRSI